MVRSGRASKERIVGCRAVDQNPSLLIQEVVSASLLKRECGASNSNSSNNSNISRRGKHVQGTVE